MAAARTSARPARQAGPAPGDVLGHVTLVTGKEEFLRERTVGAVRAAVRAHDAEAEMGEALGADLTLGTLGELSAPSLFSSTRCVVVRELEHLPEESVTGLLDYAGAPADDVALVLVHSGGPKGSGVLTKLRKLGAVTEVRTEELKPSEFPQFAIAEARLLGARMEASAANALVQAVGHDLRALAAAVDQLAHDFPDEALGEQRLEALEELRWALDNGTAWVLVTSAFAGSARGLARFKAATSRGRGMRDADLAREVGVPPWKIRTLRDQAKGWSEDGLVAAIRAVAQADADVKGAASDASYTLERLVLTIAALRS